MWLIVKVQVLEWDPWYDDADREYPEEIITQIDVPEDWIEIKWKHKYISSSLICCAANYAVRDKYDADILVAGDIEILGAPEEIRVFEGD